MYIYSYVEIFLNSNLNLAKIIISTSNKNPLMILQQPSHYIAYTQSFNPESNIVFITNL